MTNFIEFLRDRKADFVFVLALVWASIFLYHILFISNASSPSRAFVSESEQKNVASKEQGRTLPDMSQGPSKTEIEDYERTLAAYKTCTAKLEKIRKEADVRWTGYQQLQQRCETATNVGTKQRLCDLAFKQKEKFNQVAAQANFSCVEPINPKG